ncbi:MAG: polyprenyl synthetase family protein [Candidatus Peribacteraceae bacterium]|nr:polyprenyl synthetase family protein [Candidatus Peribacteraceae bacterium]
MDYFEKYRLEINRALASFLSKQKFGAQKFMAVNRYALLLGGKRVRPLLGLLAFEIAKNSRTKISRECAIQILISIELIHAFSLIQDDLPALDNDVLRRGKSTAWKKFGEANALLAGDCLALLAFKNLADSAPTRLLPELTKILADAAATMTVGQFHDLNLKENSPFKKILLTHSQKTGALIAAAAGMGAVLAGANSRQRKLLVSFAEKIGLAFQIKDDLLDATGDAKLLGKQTRKDVGKKGFVMALGVQKSQEKLDTLTCAAVEIAQELKSDKLKRLAEFISTRSK